MSDVRTVRFSSNPLKIDTEPGKYKTENLYTEPEFSLFYALCFVISIATFVADMGLHCWLAYSFHARGEILYFFLTVTFIIVPSMVSTGFSMRW